VLVLVGVCALAQGMHGLFSVMLDVM